MNKKDNFNYQLELIANLFFGEKCCSKRYHKYLILFNLIVYNYLNQFNLKSSSNYY